MSVVFHVDTPYLTPAEYARRSGLTKAAVDIQLDKGLLPVYLQKVEGKERGKRYVNNALLMKQALEG
tara:strand:+ start:1625 stop:1825 length:201 start_codon:yes stop_codon:yes gene_type:complete